MVATSKRSFLFTISILLLLSAQIAAQNTTVSSSTSPTNTVSSTNQPCTLICVSDNTCKSSVCDFDEFGNQFCRGVYYDPGYDCKISNSDYCFIGKCNDDGICQPLSKGSVCYPPSPASIFQPSFFASLVCLLFALLKM
eukprot:TRINITY_DN5542_c0_g1_i2.p1 TRINITY_DN5542_c0_g1~~TRINITY_DN5542_c0_g1_i2.p1  ORF type:complete len:139 (-),score=17.06 TRINITY_DN5542_c0_g1_i2:38-454(-)